MNYYGTEKHKKELEELEKEIFSKIAPDCLCNERDLGFGYTLKVYCLTIQKGYYGTKGTVFELYKDENEIFIWKANGNEGLAQIIEHSDGKKYLLYKEDMYGYSVLDLETLDSVHYIPELSKRGLEDGFEETFIWCEAFYDKQSDLLAVEGCYWGGIYSVIFIDFSDPMKIKEYSDWLCIGDEDYIVEKSFVPSGWKKDSIGDISFEKWTDKSLVCISETEDCSEENKTVKRILEVSKEEIAEELRS